jgi:diguanylate cyclase (GGDEF)-like protein
MPETPNLSNAPIEQPSPDQQGEDRSPKDSYPLPHQLPLDERAAYRDAYVEGLKAAERAHDIMPPAGTEARIGLEAEFNKRVRASLEEAVDTHRHREQELMGEVEGQTHIAEHDTLTGLWNREGLKKLWSELQTRAGEETIDKPASILFVDLNKFKAVNDKEGHETGDEVLQFIARILKNNTRASDIVARLGGDEFVLVLPGATVEESKTIFNRLQKALGTAGPDSHGVTLSGGIANVKGLDLEEALRRGDIAMYVSKDTPGSPAVEYDSSLPVRRGSERKISSSLHGKAY